MSGDSPTGLADAFKRACVAILVGTVALYCAVALLQSIWPTLLLIGGILTLVGIPAAGLVIYRRHRGGW
ncbi:hypothetical protein FEK35_15120 [Nocardia cyriacigeorgica]|uniref:DUF2530 domain-containing protein n=1 Tax=Nocardia cyriacigeorgica TaxID=135487 RepID=A0A5R8PCQ2_9NOCA|nr:hypothetical protein [Nocardia cyriacigeorgica]TLG09455.1 hypothetical protein FEK35_15120 [Nocardia cyriacigeorgica]